MIEPFPIYQVDAFTSRPFTGNPAGVCLPGRPMADAWHLAVAREMNLSETAFLLPRQDGWGLRWFTPQVEVELCGHATLASAHILWETERCQRDQLIRFHTLSGELHARWLDGWIELDLPLRPVVEMALPVSVSRALGGHPGAVRRAGWGELLHRNCQPGGCAGGPAGPCLAADPAGSRVDRHRPR